MLAAIEYHLEHGEFFPKLSELVSRCQSKFAPVPPTNVLPTELEFHGPDAETRKRNVEEWERTRLNGILLKEQAGDLELRSLARGMETADDGNLADDDIDKLIQLQRKLKEATP